MGAAASALLLLVSSGLNRVLTVHHQHPLQSILIFDIAGVSTLSGRADFLNDASESIPDVMRQQRSVELSALQAAYYPSTWTPLVFETDSPLAITDSAIQVEHLAAIWSGAVTAEPSIYLEHRARVFREVIGATAAPLFAPVYFGIPRDSPDYQQVAQLFPTIELVELSPVQALLRSAFEQSARSIFYRPYFWLLLNVALVITAIISGARSAGLVAIGSSGLMYELALFFLAPSADYRYSHWLVLSTWVLAFGLGSQFLQKRDQPQ
ncbi:MAG: hypothetical protein IPG64_17145 [Haliea sp.]|nr:hypothetical protein [Haliea sp.]